MGRAVWVLDAGGWVCLFESWYIGLSLLFLPFLSVYVLIFNTGVALFLASLATGRFSDWHRARLTAKSPDKKIKPETRLPIQIVGFIISAAGKVMYGWFTRYKLHPVAGLSASALGMFTLPSSNKLLSDRLYILTP